MITSPKPFTDIELLNAVETGSRKCPCLKEYAAGIEGMQDMLNEFGEKETLENISENRPENTYKKNR